VPFALRRRGSKWCVVTDERGGKTHGCHPTKGKAQAQQRALYQNTDYAARALAVEAALLSLARLTFEADHCPAGTEKGGTWLPKDGDCGEDIQKKEPEGGQRSGQDQRHPLEPDARAKVKGEDVAANNRAGEHVDPSVSHGPVDTSETDKGNWNRVGKDDVQDTTKDSPGVPGYGGRIGGDGAIDITKLVSGDEIPGGQAGRVLPTPDSTGRGSMQVDGAGHALTADQIRNAEGFSSAQELHDVRMRVLDVYPGEALPDHVQQANFDNGVRLLTKAGADVSGVQTKADLSAAIRQQRLPNGTDKDGNPKFRDGNPNRDFGQDMRGKIVNDRGKLGGGDSGDRKAETFRTLDRFGNGVTVVDPYTGVRLHADSVQIDRVIPGSQGGGYGHGNVIPSSPEANEARGDRPMEHYLAQWAQEDPTLADHPNFPESARAAVRGG
jgi:hypothetical protein